MYLVQHKINKNCEVLVSCSDKEITVWNYMQAHGTACNLMDLHGSSWTGK